MTRKTKTKTMASLMMASASTSSVRKGARGSTVSRGRHQSRRTVCSAFGSTSDALAAKDELLSKIAYIQRAEANELLLEIEAANPTPNPAMSDALIGTWKFSYMGSVAPGPIASPTRPIAMLMYAGGFTPGALALQYASMLPNNVAEVKEMTLEIGATQPQAITKATVSVGGTQQTIKVTTALSAETGRRIKETYKSVALADRSFDLPEAAQYERELFITYLDDDLLIARDATGSPDVLVKVSESASTQPPSTSEATTATEEETTPASTDDDETAPPPPTTASTATSTEEDETVEATDSNSTTNDASSVTYSWSADDEKED